MTIGWAVHISDIHVGAKASGGGWVPRATAHDLRVLEALANFLIEFHRKHGDSPRTLIVSGDLSSNGGPDELALYKTLMRRGFVLDEFVELEPLVEGFGSVLEIPGNHDYWNGWKVPRPALNQLVRARYFPPTPWTATLDVGRHVVAFHGVCSTSGANWRQQALAVGDFELADLNAVGASVARVNRAAQAAHTSPFHVLVLHHSPQESSTVLHGLTAQARTHLATICARHNLQGMLTGHRHTRIIHRAPRNQNLPVEVRSATTLQAPLPGLSQDRELFVHEFAEKGDGTLGWYATPWTFDGKMFVEEVRARATIA
jgi:hypothetical protein